MSKILLLTSKCFKDSRADGICGYNLKEALYRYNKETYLLGYSELENNGVNNNENDFCFRHIKRKSNKKVDAIKKLFYPKIDRELCKKYINESKAIIKKHGIDAVVAVYYPIETVVAMLELKKIFPNIRTIIYEVDSATDLSSFQSRLDFIRTRSCINYFKKIYSNIDYVLAMTCHKEHIIKVYGKYVKNKLFEIDSPMLKEMVYYIKPSNELINFYYTGFLDNENYSPEPFLELFRNNKNKTNWRLHMFSRGNCEDMIHEASCIDNRIIQHGYIEESKLKELIGEANVFLSIDNITKTNSIPSKTFMYFSAGKPIIHFFEKDSFVGKHYISKYPLGLTIKNEDIYYKNDLLLEFIEENSNKVLDFNSVKELFPMNCPEYSANIIISKLQNR